jgi:hypothetical protein
MRNVLKELNDRSPSEVRTLDEEELRRFEALCECWSKIAEAELQDRPDVAARREAWLKTSLN